MTQQITQTSTAPGQTTTTVPAPRHVSGVRKFFAFIGWVLTGFGLIGYFRRRGTGRSKAEEIVVYTVHSSFYLWAVILTGFVGGECVKHFPSTAPVWGWLWLFAMLYTIVCFLFDVSTLKALLWGGIFCFLFVVSEYLEDMKHLTVLSGVFRYLANLSPKLDPGMAIVLSWMLLPAWVGALFHSFSRGRKAFSPNSIEEWYLGEGREITDRSGLKFRTRYRDIFEMILGLGAGDLEAIDANQHVVKRWDNILFLVFVWPKLDEILHQRSAVVDNAPNDPVEVEEVKK
jgi:hypothetical protein